MEVKRYIYQSPYNAPVQFGRPDPAMQQSESTNYELNKKSNETLKKAQMVKNELQSSAKSTQNESVKSTVQPRVIDIYA